MRCSHYYTFYQEGMEVHFKSQEQVQSTLALVNYYFDVVLEKYLCNSYSERVSLEIIRIESNSTYD